jgi:hypothetical protein
MLPTHLMAKAQTINKLNQIGNIPMKSPSQKNKELTNSQGNNTW